MNNGNEKLILELNNKISSLLKENFLLKRKVTELEKEVEKLCKIVLKEQ